MFNVETYQLGYWESIFTTNNLVEACREASFLCLTIREEWVRIEQNGKILFQMSILKLS